MTDIENIQLYRGIPGKLEFPTQDEIDEYERLLEAWKKVTHYLHSDSWIAKISRKFKGDDKKSVGELMGNDWDRLVELELKTGTKLFTSDPNIAVTYLGENESENAGTLLSIILPRDLAEKMFSGMATQVDGINGGAYPVENFSVQLPLLKSLLSRDQVLGISNTSAPSLRRNPNFLEKLIPLTPNK